MVARLAVTLALSFGFLSPALAQNVQGGGAATGSAKETETGPQPGRTGAGQRGTEVGPSTNPSQSGQEKH